MREDESRREKKKEEERRTKKEDKIATIDERSGTQEDKKLPHTPGSIFFPLDYVVVRHHASGLGYAEADVREPSFLRVLSVAVCRRSHFAGKKLDNDCTATTLSHRLC